jgi:hypothetical protein
MISVITINAHLTNKVNNIPAHSRFGDNFKTERLITKAYVVKIQLPHPQPEAGERLTSVGIMGRGSPTPTFFLEDRTDIGPLLYVKFAVHRSFVVIDIAFD